jgi:hypothetical protein
MSVCIIEHVKIGLSHSCILQHPRHVHVFVILVVILVGKDIWMYHIFVHVYFTRHHCLGGFWITTLSLKGCDFVRP